MVDYNLIASLNVSEEDIENQLSAALGSYDKDTIDALVSEAAPHQAGTVLKGRIVDVIGNNVVVEVGLKSEGMVDISEFSDPDKVRNTAAHQREGQNVLYVDAHVAFEKAPNVGIEDDNIYICWVSNYLQTAGTAKEKMQLGEQSGMPNTKKGDKKWGPYAKEDAFLVNEYNSKN